MTTDGPPLPMSHTGPGIGPNISTCVQRCRCHVCIEQKIFLTTNVTNRQTHTKHNNIAKVIHKYGQNKR